MKTQAIFSKTWTLFRRKLCAVGVEIDRCYSACLLMDSCLKGKYKISWGHPGSKNWIGRVQS